MKRVEANLYFIILLLTLLVPFGATGQGTTIKGVVTDAKTGEPVPFATIAEKAKGKGTTADYYGKYLYQTDDSVSVLTYSAIGYTAVTKKVVPHITQVINVKLPVAVKELAGVTINSSKKKYSNKNNPAVDLIRKVIDHKKLNRQGEIAAYQYEKYEKVQFALSNIPDNLKNKRLLRKFQFVFNNIDSTQLPGKKILPMYLSENLSEVYYRKSPKETKEIVSANRKVEFGSYIDNAGVTNTVKYLYQDIDIYKNTIPILTNDFISPIADDAPIFYRYYITDTEMVNNIECYKVSFYPRNKTDMVFYGDLYIKFDSTYAVCKEDMSVFPDINLNFARDLKIIQEYRFIDTTSWVLSKDELSIDFGVSKNGMGIFGQRSLTLRNFVLNKPKPDDFYKGDAIVMPDSATARSDAYWNNNRYTQLTKSEKSVYHMMDTIQRIPTFKHVVSIATLLFAGYHDFGLFEIGPANTFYSYNPIEGFRLRFGGRTTKKFSQKLNLETYAAYGFLDEKWKYYIGGTWALGKKPFNEFPLNNLTASYQQETKIPGQELQFVQEDNILLSIKRGPNDKLLYNKIFNLDYLHEFTNHFSFETKFKRLVQAPAGTLYFNQVDYNDAPQYNIPSITTDEFTLKLHIAPNEQFYQGKNYRVPMYGKNPIFEISFTQGVKGLFGDNSYNYQHIHLSLFKRIFESPFGYSDVLLEGGQIFGRVPYPLLDIARANQSYSLQLESYNLMNFLEFVSDRYVALNVTHFFNGFFFNKIPVIKKLKWREVASVKVLYGTVTNNNNPDLHPELFKFPVSADGTPQTYTLDKEPYIEASVGIANIFKLFRIELIRRFTYLNHPNVAEYGIRGRFKIDF